MFNLFKKNKEDITEQTPTSEDESTIDASELGDYPAVPDEEQEIHTDLSIHPDWKLNEEDEYVFRFRNNELPSLKPNQISLAGYEMNKLIPEIAVGAFIRSSIDKKISLKNTPLLLISESGEKLAKKEFDLSKVGELPARSSRPWSFIFNKEDLLVAIDDIPSNPEMWKLAFELKKNNQRHALDLEKSWQKSMADEDIKKMEDIVESLNPPKHGEVNFLGLKALMKEDDLHVTMLIRNGNEKDITLQKLPMQVEDKNGEIIARGGFKLENFVVKANTSKPWTFIFPAGMLTKSDMDLSKWKAYPIQNK